MMYASLTTIYSPYRRNVTSYSGLQYDVQNITTKVLFERCIVDKERELKITLQAIKNIYFEFFFWSKANETFLMWGCWKSCEKCEKDGWIGKTTPKNPRLERFFGATVNGFIIFIYNNMYLDVITYSFMKDIK
jgi:hypothetical protein